jgi:16S rRNA (guanine966-N2)-methyltransferase
MRIVGGRLGGRTLAAPKSQGASQRASTGPFQEASFRAPQGAFPLANAPIRPTSDRLRESLFNILLHSYGDPVNGARVLDLFAGTGALGLEAMSRGAAFALFIDDGAEARALIRANVEALGLGGTTRIFRRDATNLGPVHPLEPFTLAFLDPPYRRGLAERSLAALAAGGWLAPGALIVVEEAAHATFAPPPGPPGFAEIERRRYDDSELTFLRAAEHKTQPPVHLTEVNPPRR